MAIYVKNSDLFKEIVECKQKGELSHKALEMFQIMIKKIGLNFRYRNPSDREDCESEAMLSILKYWRRFDETRFKNAFAYFTQCIKNGYGLGYNRIYPEKIKTVSISAFEVENF